MEAPFPTLGGQTLPTLFLFTHCNLHELHTHSLIHLLIYPPLSLSILLSIYLPVHFLIHPLTLLFIHPAISHLSTYLLTCPSIHSSICPAIYPSLNPTGILCILYMLDTDLDAVMRQLRERETK